MVRDFEREQNTYRPGLRLRSLRFLSDTEIELDFEGIETPDRTFVASRSEGPIPGVNFDGEFSRLYRGIPYVSVGHSFNPLIGQMFVARHDELPADEAWERVRDESEKTLAERWRTKGDSSEGT